MLSRLIVRLLFRVTFALALLLGVASYVHYLSGGDPGALWGKVAGGAGERLGGAFAGLRERVAAPAATLAGTAASGSGGRRDSVWTWRDADGVTHYATARPAGADATLVTVDPDTNLLAPPPARPVPSGSRAVPDAPASGGRGGGTRAADDGRSGRDGAGDGAEKPLPGIAGAALRARGDAPSPDPATAEALLRLLRTPSR